MNIAIIGYGKMGREIEAIALERKHTIVLKISSENLSELTAEHLRKADAAIEFTTPHAAAENILFCLKNNVPVVSGSTGWYERKTEIETACTAYNGSLLVASNFSIGVNIFFEVNKLLARLMNNQPGYEISMTEIHHTAKKDAPSGTAITLAEQMLEAIERKTKWVNQLSNHSKELTIKSERIDPAPGTHIISYNSMADSIEIKHTAHNRSGFALGAVLAAEYIHDKKGIFSMQDVLGLYPASPQKNSNA